MSFDAVSFFQNYGIEYRLEGHKHCRPGWVYLLTGARIFQEAILYVYGYKWFPNKSR